MAKTLLETIRERRSVRAYRGQPVETEKIDRLVQALIWAPSSGNFQCRRFFFIRSPQLIRSVAEECFDHAWIARAPLVVICCRDDRIDEHYGPGSARFAVQDVSASIQNLLLAAHADGLGSCWVCAFDEAGLERRLDLPPGLHPVALVTVGYADEEPPVPDRVGPGEAITWLD